MKTKISSDNQVPVHTGKSPDIPDLEKGVRFDLSGEADTKSRKAKVSAKNATSKSSFGIFQNSVNKCIRRYNHRIDVNSDKPMRGVVYKMFF